MFSSRVCKRREREADDREEDSLPRLHLALPGGERELTDTVSLSLLLESSGFTSLLTADRHCL